MLVQKRICTANIVYLNEKGLKTEQATQTLPILNLSKVNKKDLTLTDVIWTDPSLMKSLLEDASGEVGEEGVSVGLFSL